MNGVQRVFSISRRQLSMIAAALALAGCHIPVNEQPPAPELGSGYRTDLTARHAERHMAAAANPLAAEAGREMLRQGGSAIDAAIAMQAVLTLVEPQSSGIGGGAFIMLGTAKPCTRMTAARRRPRELPNACSLKPTARRWHFPRRRLAGVRLARQACYARWRCHTKRPATCNGPSCLNRRFGCPSKASRFPRACTR